MKHFKLLLCLLLIFLLGGTAYSLNNFWYNGYAIDGTGQILPNTTVNVRVSIYNGTTLAYQETHAGVATDQFGSLTVEVGTGAVVVPGLAGITTTADTKIMLETNNGPGWVLTRIASISSVMINTTVVPGSIDLPQHKIIIGDALGYGEALLVGGDMSATNDGSTANYQINSGAVGTAEIADGSILNQDINVNANIAVTKLAAGGANQFLVNNSTNAWAGLNVGASLQGNGVGTALGINLTNANTWTGQQIFNTANPRTPLAPVIGDDITNKTYVDAADATKWSITGNSGLTAGTNFIGTTDDAELHLDVRNGATISQSLRLGTNQSIYRETVVGGTVAGNARGQFAVDMQIVRATATLVASGDYSTLGGGISNTTSGDYSTVGGGYTNSATSHFSTVGGGGTNSATGDYSTVGGGYTNSASGNFSTVGGGLYASADKYGQNAYASGRFANTGDAQTSVYVARNQTSGAGWTTLFLDGASINLSLGTNATWTFRILIVGKPTGGTSNGAAYEITGAVTNNVGTASILGTPTVTTIYESNASYNAQVTVSGANLVVQVEGNGDALRWVARIETAEVTW